MRWLVETMSLKVSEILPNRPVWLPGRRTEKSPACMACKAPSSSSSAKGGGASPCILVIGCGGCWAKTCWAASAAAVLPLPALRSCLMSSLEFFRCPAGQRHRRYPCPRLAALTSQPHAPSAQNQPLPLQTWRCLIGSLGSRIFENPVWVVQNRLDGRDRACSGVQYRADDQADPPSTI